MKTRNHNVIGTLSLTCLMLFAVPALHAQVEGESTPVTVSTQPKDTTTRDAEFPGGMEALGTFIASNIDYPKDAMDSKQEGTVYVSFEVERDGSITEIAVVGSVSESLDNEAIRVVQLMPKWNPALMKGKAVRSNYYMPIHFKLD